MKTEGIETGAVIGVVPPANLNGEIDNGDFGY